MRKTTKNLSQNSRCPSRNSNRALPLGELARSHVLLAEWYISGRKAAGMLVPVSEWEAVISRTGDSTPTRVTVDTVLIHTTQRNENSACDNPCVQSEKVINNHKTPCYTGRVTVRGFTHVKLVYKVKNETYNAWRLLRRIVELEGGFSLQVVNLRGRDCSYDYLFFNLLKTESMSELCYYRRSVGRCVLE
jgi:hypothetical protein